LDSSFHGLKRRINNNLQNLVVPPILQESIYIQYSNRKYKGIDEMGEANLDEFFCPNEACPDYGKKGRENIVLKERYDKQNAALLRCKTCKETFSD